MRLKKGESLSISGVLHQQPKAYTQLIVDLITQQEIIVDLTTKKETVAYVIDEKMAPDLLNKLNLRSPVDPMLGEQLIKLIQENPEFADRIFKLLPDWNAWLTPKQADGLLSWTLNKPDEEVIKEDNQKIIQQIADKKLPISSNPIINLIKTKSTDDCLKLLNTIPCLRKLCNAPALLKTAAENGDTALVDLIYKLSLPLDNLDKGAAINAALFPDYMLRNRDNWSVLQYFFQHEFALFSSFDNNLAVNFLHEALARADTTLAKSIFNQFDTDQKYALLLQLVDNHNLASLYSVLNKFLVEPQLQELLLKNNNKLLLLFHDERGYQSIIKYYKIESLLPLLLDIHARGVSLEELNNVILSVGNNFLVTAIEKNLTDILQGLLLLYAENNLPLLFLTPTEKIFVAQIDWQNFNTDAFPLSANKFNFLREKMDLPYLNYVDYIFNQLQKPVNDQNTPFINRIYQYISDEEIFVPILQRLITQLNEDNWLQFIPVDDNGNPTTYLGEALFNQFEIFDNPVMDLEDLIQRINGSLALEQAQAVDAAPIPGQGNPAFVP
jgi:hypothetical protein